LRDGREVLIWRCSLECGRNYYHLKTKRRGAPKAFWKLTMKHRGALRWRPLLL
jgi:hypothetical protein